MANLGVDYSWSRPDPQQLIDEGYKFVIRYISYDETGKNLTVDELETLCAVGLSVVLAWNHDISSPLYGYDWGKSDASAALTMATELNCPDDCPIYFAVDFDVNTEELPEVMNYFAGVAEVIGWERVGVYGSHTAIEHAARYGWAGWFWQKFAWSHGKIHPANHIYQYSYGEDVGGAEVNINNALKADIGAWGMYEIPDDSDELVDQVWAYSVSADVTEDVPASEALTETYMATTIDLPEQLTQLRASVDRIEQLIQHGRPSEPEPDPCTEHIRIAVSEWLTRFVTPPRSGRHRYGR